MIFHRVHRIIYAAVVRLQFSGFVVVGFCCFFLFWRGRWALNETICLSHTRPSHKCIVSGGSCCFLAFMHVGTIYVYIYIYFRSIVVACLLSQFSLSDISIPILLYSCQYWNVVFNSNRSIWVYLCFSPLSLSQSDSLLI